MSPSKRSELDDQLLYQLGRGMWSAFRKSETDIEEIYEAAEHWGRALEGIERPWLVWNAHDDWCVVQQKLVESTGWTPVVGFDPRVGPPTLTKNAVFVDFNEKLQLPYMSPMFVMEFIFLFAERLAFWHSDLLITESKIQDLADRFVQLRPGETIATDQFRMTRFWRKSRRFWELVGCSTREASRDQYERGAGWWCHIQDHLNCTTEQERQRREGSVYWDHGAGIKYWHEFFGGPVVKIPISSVEKGHFSPVTYPNLYTRIPESVEKRTRNLKGQLDANIGVIAACQKMGIDYAQLLDSE